MEYFEKEKVLKRLRCLCEIAAEPPMDDEDSKKLRMLQALEKEFEKAKRCNHIQKPMAYALYQVWKRVDGREKPRC